MGIPPRIAFGGLKMAYIFIKKKGSESSLYL